MTTLLNVTGGNSIFLVYNDVKNYDHSQTVMYGYFVSILLFLFMIMRPVALLAQHQLSIAMHAPMHASD